MIENAGEFESTGGRKAAIYQCVSNSRCAVGINITRNHLTIVLIDLALNIAEADYARGMKGIEGIAAVADGHDIVALVFQEQYMGFQQIDFIVCPKDAIHSKKR